jgi:hypothetical protein
MMCPCQGPSVQNVPRTNFEVDFEPAGANMKTTCGSMSCSAVNPKLGTKCGTANANGYQVKKQLKKIKLKVRCFGVNEIIIEKDIHRWKSRTHSAVLLYQSRFCLTHVLHQACTSCETYNKGR